MTPRYPDATTPEEIKSAKKAAELVKYWNGELTAARKREKLYRKDASRVVKIYEGQEEVSTPFNILYSNTETMLPALYANVPRPVVQRRFKDADPLGALASKAAERGLTYLADSNDMDYETFDSFMKAAVVDSLVTGRGVTFFRYDAELTQQAPGAEVGATDEAAPAEVAAVETPGMEAQEQVSYETACAEIVPWNRFLHGYARSWKRVPWIAVEHFFTRAEMKKNYPDLYQYVPLDCTPADEESENQESGRPAEDPENTTKLAYVVEIWDRTSKRVYHIAPSFSDRPLRNVPDPLDLSGFFPCPKPLTFVERVSELTPVCLYTFYKQQAEELNNITLRIKNLIKAIKVRGFYDATLEGLDKLLEQEENTLLPVNNMNALQQGQSADKSLWFMPVEKLIVVLQQLMQERQAVKQVIYEITGISDILRGASSASETATAQNIKSQWGSLRIKRLQKEVMRYSRDAFRILAEIAATKFSEETWAGITGLGYPTSAQKQEAQALVQQYQALGAPVPPEAQQLLDTPSWGDVLGMLRDDLVRHYRIDIETNSTIDAEASEDKQNITELLNAMAQFLSGVSPLVQSGAMPFEVAQTMLMTIVRRFQFGAEVEDALKGMKPPAPPQEAGKGADSQGQMELEKLKLGVEQKRAEMEERKMALEFQQSQAEHTIKMQELAQKSELANQTHAHKMEALKQQTISSVIQSHTAKVSGEGK